MSLAMPVHSVTARAVRSVRKGLTTTQPSRCILPSCTRPTQSRGYFGPLAPPREDFETPEIRPVKQKRTPKRKTDDLLKSINNPNPTEWLLPIPENTEKMKKRKPLPQPIRSLLPNRPLSVVRAAEIAERDPTGARTRLFDKTNPEGVNPGDIIMVRQRTGEPFAGVIIRLIRKNIDTSVLLRNSLTNIGVEMEFKVYSPNVTSIEVVKRREKIPMYSRLYYMRKPEHDIGSVENIVRAYLRQKGAFGGRLGGAGAGTGSGKAKRR